MNVRELDKRVLAFFFFQAEDGIRVTSVTGVQTCALPISKLTRLTLPTQNAVRDLACLGNSAAIATLAQVHGTTEAQIHSLLDEAVRAELLERRRSEERRVGKEGRSRWSTYRRKKTKLTGR